ncbi:MAG: flagellar filament capping protein FliD, partial [Chitinivibrionales bacterium]|nr:flagellar filament capping protein FliD [Chitinivibrionales bacterium]MBD3358065.1 flagellar filament capping protein FliD [Chitinivibrionales bacterium]
RNRVRVVEEKIDAYEVKIDAYSKLRSLVADIGHKAGLLQQREDFNLFTSNSSNENIVSFTAGLGSDEGRYDLRVSHLAQAEKMVSTEGLITSQSASLSSMGINVGDIEVDGQAITIGADDTLQDLRMKINNATDAEGNELGVTATVLKIADDNFRLVLTSKEEGAEGVSYRDLTGSTLQDLGIIQDTAGTKGTTAQMLQSGTDVRSAFEALTEGEVVRYEGVDHMGNNVRGSYTVTASSTTEDLLKDIGDTFHGMVEASIGAGGELILTDKVAGESALAVNTLSVGGTDHAMSTTRVGNEGGGVLQAGSNAYFSVDGLYMESSGNSASGFISGVTLDFKKASVDETVAISMDRDLDAITDNVQNLVDSFNELANFVNTNTRYAVDEEDETVKKGELAGDMTARSILSRIRSVFHSRFDTLSGEYQSLAEIGLKTNTQTGELKLDAEKFKTALQGDYDDVVKLFVTTGFSDNSNITLGRYTEDTAEGNYVMEEVDADHMRIKLSGDDTWYTSGPRTGDVITFGDGPVDGLSLTAPSGSIGAASASFTFSRGLTGQLKGVVDQLNDGREGLIHMRQESWRISIRSSQDRVDRLEASVEAYRMRLVKEFSAMEQSLSELQSQSTNMLSALGFNGA